MRIEAVIFDMDGLMLDTEPLYREACQRAAAEFGYTLSDAIHSRLMGRNVADAEAVVVEEFGPAFPMDAFRARCLALEGEFQAGPSPKKPGLDELLDFLDLRGIAKAVATSSRRTVLVPQLAATGILDRFGAVATGDEVTNGKPAPELFLLAAQRLGVDPVACLVLEDAEPGVVAAHRAGMRVFMVPDIQGVSATAERHANRIFESLVEVKRYLELVLPRNRLDSFDTERLTALPLRSEDLQDLCLMHRDPEVMKYMGGVRSEEKTKIWLHDDLAHWNAHGFGCWIFSDRASRSFVGRSGLRRVQLDNADEVEVGYALAKNFWGIGLGTEMARAIVTIGFERLELENVIALVDLPNIASSRVAEKLGFRFERNTIWKSEPAMLYRLERGEWIKRQTPRALGS